MALPIFTQDAFSFEEGHVILPHMERWPGYGDIDPSKFHVERFDPDFFYDHMAVNLPDANVATAMLNAAIRQYREHGDRRSMERTGLAIVGPRMEGVWCSQGNMGIACSDVEVV